MVRGQQSDLNNILTVPKEQQTVNREREKAKTTNN